MKKRFLSILLTVCMILSLMPTVFAVETEVAQVGATKYDTLQAAINAAGAGDTVTLLRDITIDALIKIEENITLDLGGKKVTSTAKKAFEIYSDATIQNGTIEAVNRCVDTRKAVALTLSNLTLIADNYTSAYSNPQPLTVGGYENGTEITMDKVNISADDGYCIITFVETDLTATNSNFEGYNVLYVKPGSEGSVFNFIGSTLTGDLSDNDVEGNSFSVIAIRADDVTVNVDETSTINAIGNYIHAISDGGDAAGEETTTGVEVTIKGTINGNVVGSTESTGNTIIVPEEYTEELIDDSIVAVIKNGNTVKVFFSIQAAINAASEGDTVTVLKDIVLTEGITVPADKTITLDLNGKTVSMIDSSGAAAALINNLGTLTINDSVGGGKLTFVTTTPGGQSYVSNTISNRGVLIINDGTIENTSNGPACYALDCFAGSTATINGGKLTALRTAVRIFNWSATPAKLNITGGEIVAGSGYAININMGNTPSVELNISGGTITTTSNSYNLAVYAYMTDNSSYSAENVKINITGGTFNGNVALNGKTSASFTEGNISVSGGSMDGVICYDTPAHGFISGGTFKAAPADDNLVEGYALEESTDENGDPVYGIIIDPEQTVFAAAVNGVGYETLEEAIDAVENGGTIQLLNDATLTSQIKITGKSFNIEGNGNKITGTGALWLLSGTYNINNVVFENINYTATFGILEFTYATANITNCTFTGNVAQSCIAVDTNADNDGNSNVTIEGCTFVNNNCSTCLIHSAEGTTTVENSKITGNTSGIAVIYNSANLNVNGNVFEDNTLTGDNANQAVILSGPWVEGSYELNVNENVFLDDILGVYVESFVDDVANDLNDNYWNGGEPSVTVEDGADVALDSYYLEYSVDADGNITFDTVVLVSETGDSLYPVTFRTKYDSIFEVKTADGKVIAPIGGIYYLANGEYTVTASALGYWPKAVRFYVTGAAKTVTIFLDPVIIAPVIKPEIPEKPEVIDPVVKNPFTDVSKNDYFYDAVLWAIENEITSGTTATTFSPNAVCTRAHAVTFLWNAAGKPEPTSTSLTFTDVSADAYYYKAVLWAVENGIIYGTSETAFAPDAECTRSQIVTMLWRNAGCPVSKVTTDNFNDVAENNYYYLAVLWAVENEITIGTTTTTFSPDADCTRGQIVTFMYRELADK